MPQRSNIIRRLTVEQVAIVRGLLHSDSMKGISQFERLLRRRPLLDLIAYPAIRAGLCGRLVYSVEEDGGNDGADGPVKAALLLNLCQ